MKRMDNRDDRDDKNLLFIAELSDGYSFRNLVEYLKTTNSRGNFIFREDGIHYSQSDSSNKVLNIVDIRACDLSYYRFFSAKPEIVIGINIPNFRTITKSIGKKDGARIYMYQNDPLLYIRILNQNTKMLNKNNVNIIRPQSVERAVYVVGEYKNPETSPNCTVPSIDFSKMCSAMNALRCSSVILQGYPKGVVFQAVLEGELIGRVDRFGDCNTDEMVPNFTSTPVSDEFTKLQIGVELSTIKALTKLNNLSTNGTIKIYMEPDLPIKIICNIGTYGRLTIHLDDSS